MQKWYETIVDKAGNAQEGVAVAIYLTGTSTLAVLYEDDGTTQKINPLTSNDLGFVSAKVANGKYDIQPGSDDRIVGVDIFDQTDVATYDPADVAITGGTINGVVIGGIAPPDATFNNATVNGDFKN